MIGLQPIQLFLLTANSSSKHKFQNFPVPIANFPLQLIISLLPILRLRLYCSQPLRLPLCSLCANSHENYSFLLKEVKSTNRSS